jgi:hypothetical protein
VMPGKAGKLKICGSTSRKMDDSFILESLSCLIFVFKPTFDVFSSIIGTVLGHELGSIGFSARIKCKINGVINKQTFCLCFSH